MGGKRVAFGGEEDDEYHFSGMTCTQQRQRQAGVGGERHDRGVAGTKHEAPAGVVVVEHRENEGMTLKVGSRRTRRDMPFVEVFDLSRYLVFEGMGRVFQELKGR